jgi:quercetin dioxygenase-like cupin family protein
MPAKMARSDPQTPFGRLEWRQPAAPGSSASNRFRKCVPFTPVQVSSGESRSKPIEAMERMMMRFMLFVFVALLCGTGRLAAQQTVEARDVTSVVKVEEVTFGHLTELNGKFKLRATEMTFAPGGYIGVHHHVGPGIRYVISGELTFAEGGQETVYKAGEYYYETGNLAHTGENKTNLPLRVLVIEILPQDWTGPAVIQPKSQ